MNTPTPCNMCNQLYYDVMHEDDPSYAAECKISKIPESGRCSYFDAWESKASQEIYDAIAAMTGEKR